MFRAVDLTKWYPNALNQVVWLGIRIFLYLYLVSISGHIPCAWIFLIVMLLNDKTVNELTADLFSGKPALLWDRWGMSGTRFLMLKLLHSATNPVYTRCTGKLEFPIKSKAEFYFFPGEAKHIFHLASLKKVSLWLELIKLLHFILLAQLLTEIPTDE